MRKKFNKCKVILLVSLWMISAWQVFGQEVQITGKVTDSNTKEVMPGVNVVVKGTTKGVGTDAQGTFKLSVPAGSTLVFTFVGYKTQEVVIGNAMDYQIALESEVSNLEEVVVIGYGTVKKSDATGSVVAVDSKDFNKGAINSAQDLLAGKTAGVVITDASGDPNSGVTIRIRGGSSLNASNDPLIVVDGIPIDNNAANGSSNILSFLNPNDVESFTVLKDASATAIYGSRASNGVIIITTKKGTSGSQLKISYNGTASLSAVSKYMGVFSGDQLRQLAASLVNLNGIASLSVLGNQNTNWQSQIFQVSMSQDHNLSLTGSYKFLPYHFSVGYTDKEGILLNSDFKRGTGSFNLSPVFFDKSLKVNINGKGEYTNQNYGDAGAVGNAVRMDPTQPVNIVNPASANYFEWANLGISQGTANPVAQAKLIQNNALIGRFMGNIQLDYANPLIPELHANLNLGTDNTQSSGTKLQPPTLPTTLTQTAYGHKEKYDGINSNNLLDFYLNYAKEFSAISSRIDLTAGYSWQHFKEITYDYSHSIFAAGYTNQVLDSVKTLTEYYLVSFFGRLNYTLLNRYLLTATLRDDGSSRFSPSNQWGLFPSVALAWKINEEPFLKNVTAISDFKLRLGYGVTGQQNILNNNYPSQALYQYSIAGAYQEIAPGQYIRTLRPNAYDPNIKWEQTTTQNIGLDLGFLKNRFTASFDIYKRVTDRLIEYVAVPAGSNYSNYVNTNVGSLQNQGYEVTLNLVPISQKDMSLTIGFNLTYNQNKITKLSLNSDPTYIIQSASADLSSNYLQVQKVGSPANSWFMNKQVYNQQGQPLEGTYVDLSGQGGALADQPKDMYVDHNPAPDYTMGISARFNYKNFDATATGRIELGNYVYNYNAASVSYGILYTEGYWRNAPSFLNDTKFVNRQYQSDYFVQNASFFKLDNISVGYNFNKIYNKLLLRISFTAQNLIIVTPYKGQDPEVGYNGTSWGIDNNLYPRSRTYLVGLSLTY